MYSLMVYTRSQKTPSLFAAVQALLTLRGSTAPLSVITSYSEKNTIPSTPSNALYWSLWTNWYHAFVAEVTDEFSTLPIAERRAQATSRWVTFASKKLKCSESQVRAWLRTADQKALVAAYA